MKPLKLLSLFFAACIILSSCGQATPTIPGGDSVQPAVPGSVAPEIVLGATNTEIVELTVEVVKQQNCGGSAEAENEYIKSHSVEHVIEAQGGFSVNVNGQIGFAGTDVELGATVATQLGHAYGTVEVISRSLTVKAKPGTNMEHSIKQTEVWKVGTARVKVGDEEATIPFRFRHDFAIELVDSRDVGCASLTETAPQPTVTVPTETKMPQGNPPAQPGVLTIGVSQTANLAKDAHDEHKLAGTGNVPVLVSIETPDSQLSYRLEIFDDLGNRLEARDSSDTLAWPFTPPKDGEYTLRVTGLGGFGGYNIRVEYIDIESQRNRQSITIGVNEVQRDTLALRAYDEYRLAGTGNVPVLVSIATPDSQLSYRLEIFDDLGNRLEARDSSDTLAWPFTPPKDGEYTLRVTGLGGYGSYNIRVEYIDIEAQRNRQSVTIEMNEVQRDTLAFKAYDEYVFIGTANVPVLVSIATPDSQLSYRLEIFDDLGNRLEARDSSDTLAWPFTPPKDGEYTLRITGLGGYGSYNIRVENNE